MGGFKSCGQISNLQSACGRLETGNSYVNFVVPNRQVIREEITNAGLNCDQPGVLEGNIKVFAESNSNISCKICIDGNKISSGFGKKLGDVNLFGYEENPTLETSQKKLTEKLDLINVITNILSKHEMKWLNT